MFLALNSLRPTSFQVLNDINGTTLVVYSPLPVTQAIDVLKVPGVSRDVFLHDFVKQDGDSECYTSGNITIRSCSLGCSIEIPSAVNPLFSLVSGISVVW